MKVILKTSDNRNHNFATTRDKLAWVNTNETIVNLCFAQITLIEYVPNEIAL